MSRSARPITRLARFVAGEAALPARVRVLRSRERIGAGSATLRGLTPAQIASDFKGELFTLMPPYSQWYSYKMANRHHPPDPPTSDPTRDCSPSQGLGVRFQRDPTKTIFDKTNPPVDRGIAKTTTYGRNWAFRRISFAHNRVTFDQPWRLRGASHHEFASPSGRGRRARIARDG